MLLTVHQRGLTQENANKINTNIDDIKIGTEVSFEKGKGLMPLFSDKAIVVCLNNKIIGYASEVPTYLMDGCTIVTKDVYDSLPNTFKGTIEEVETNVQTTPFLFSVKIDE